MSKFEYHKCRKEFFMILVESYKSACKDYAASFLKNNCMDILLYKPANCDCCKPQPVPVWEAYIRNFYSIIPASINLKFVNLFNDKNVSTLALLKHIRAYFDRNKKFEDILTYSSWLINRNQEIFGTKTKKQAFESMKEDVVSNLILLMHYDHVSRWQIRFIDSNRYVVEDDNRIGVYHCQKRTSEKEKIDENVKNIIEVHKKRGTEPTVPMGDNCYGYVSGFKYLEQGYDKDKN